ncbi:MAG: hypothetical protein AAFX87_14485 [Bacteroidota bacterium]
MRPTIFLSLTLIVLLQACQSEPEEKLLDEQAYIDFGKMIETAFNEGDAETFHKNFDADHFTDLALKDFGYSLDDAEIKRGAKEDLASFGKEIVRAVKADDGLYSFIRYYEKDNRAHLIFRLYGLEGLNYHDYELSTVDGEIRIVDLYIFLSGESISKTMGRLFGLLFNKEESSVFSRSIDDENFQAFQKLTEIKSKLNLFDYIGAYNLFEELPDELKKEKMGHILNMQILVNMDKEDEYKAAINNYRRNFPDDPSLDLVLIDYYTIKEDWDKLIQSIDNLDKSVGGDELLEAYRGYAMLGAEQYEEAQMKFENIADDFPKIEEFQFALLTTLLFNEQYDRVIKQAEVMKRELELTNNDFDFTDFPEFLESDVYRNWQGE